MAWLQIIKQTTGATLFKIMKEENLTYQDIREASTNYLRSLLKEDIDVELHDMVTKELFEVREKRRPIGSP